MMGWGTNSFLFQTKINPFKIHLYTIYFIVTALATLMANDGVGKQYRFDVWRST